MIEGIENKEPSSPRIHDGEFIADENKFLPPPKTVGEPRLFIVRQHEAVEFSNERQLEYKLRRFKKDQEVKQTHSKVMIENEAASL
jgi:hypothetical protein